MSNFEEIKDIDELKHIKAVIRKPQSGKTYVCLKSIANAPDSIHIILTMNTIIANDQFKERCSKDFKDKYIIHNSKKKSGLLDVSNAIKSGKINIVIMCAHPVRFKNTIGELLLNLVDSRSFNKNIIIHIDEAHAYIEKNREIITDWNKSPIVSNIICYTGTHLKLWKKDDILWNNIYIVDISEQYEIIKNNKYFGVKNAQIIHFENVSEIIDMKIPAQIVEVCKAKKINWYTKHATSFSNGDEFSYLCYVKSVLKHLYNEKLVKNDSFSYNFIPAYNRVMTHIFIRDLIKELFDDAIVVIFNGNLSVKNKYYYKNESYDLSTDSEISKKIENIMNKYPNKPIFITGFNCLSMSVTLINENTGNFDNMIMSHEQYINQPDVLYQMCRFLFSYINWKDINIKKIKKTKIFTRYLNVIDKCIEYEEQVEYIEDYLSGSVRSQDEVSGDLKPEIKTVIKIDDNIKKYAKCEIKTFTVDDEEEEKAVWERLKKFYNNFVGKKLNANKIPDKINNFYHCSTTKNKTINQKDELKRTIEAMSSTSNFILKSGNYKYTRLYVGYDDITKPHQYAIYLRYMTLENNEIVNKHLENKKVKVLKQVNNN
jgi:hypothetical protein